MSFAMNRKEYLKHCKKRALEYIDDNDLAQAWTSMASDLRWHEETKEHPDINRGMMMIIAGGLSTPQEMREFIEGFN